MKLLAFKSLVFLIASNKMTPPVARPFDAVSKTKAERQYRNL